MCRRRWQLTVTSESGFDVARHHDRAHSEGAHTGCTLDGRSPIWGDVFAEAQSNCVEGHEYGTTGRRTLRVQRVRVHHRLRERVSLLPGKRSR